MALAWMAAGHRVIHHEGPFNPPSADVLFLHVNQTLVPEEYANCVSKYPVAINGRVFDISRKRYSSIKLEKDCRYDGPVIVKTDKNYGGVPEHRSSFKLFSLASRMLKPPQIHRWRGITNSWGRLSSLDPLEYPIFNSMQDVPLSVWNNHHLIVEKFIPEREKGLYFVRYWTFLGNVSLSGRYGCPHPIVKFRRCVTKITPVDIPEELISLREQLKMDYGRFDYVMHEGKPVVLDVNKTQAAGPLTDETRKQVETLSAGIYFYLKG